METDNVTTSATSASSDDDLIVMSVGSPSASAVPAESTLVTSVSSQRQNAGQTQDCEKSVPTPVMPPERAPEPVPGRSKAPGPSTTPGPSKAPGPSKPPVQRKRRRPVAANNNTDDSESDLSDVGGEGMIDGVEDSNFTLPTQAPLMATQKLPTLMDYFSTASFMRFTVSERSWFERTLRAYLISQFDCRLTPHEALALNNPDVAKRGTTLDVCPDDECEACRRSDHELVERSTTALKSTTNQRRRYDSNMQYSQAFSTVVHFPNPLYKKFIARLPDLRLLGHNANKLVSVIAPTLNRVTVKRSLPETVPLVHICQRLYGNFELWNNRTAVNYSFKSSTIRPLVFYNSYPSPACLRAELETLDHQIEPFLRKIKTRRGARRPRIKIVRGRRSMTPPPPYSIVSAGSRFGIPRLRLSRSQSPVRNRHPAFVRSPVAYKTRFTKIEADEKISKFTFSQRSPTGAQRVCFSFPTSEVGIFIPAKPPALADDSKIKKMSFRGFTSRFNVFELSVAEDRPFEYLLQLRFINNHAQINELRPEARYGAVLPIRMVYNYLRMLRTKWRPVTWNKAVKRKKFQQPAPAAAQSKKPSLLASRKGIKPLPPSMAPSRATRSFATTLDALKYLGCYAVSMNVYRHYAKFVFVGEYWTNIYMEGEELQTNLFDVILCYPQNMYSEVVEDTSSEWQIKVNAIKELVFGGKKRPNFSQSRVYITRRLNSKVISLEPYFPIEAGLLMSHNLSLENSFQKFLNRISTVDNDLHDDDFGAPLDEAINKDSVIFPDNESIIRSLEIGATKSLWPGQYSLGDGSKAVMRDPDGKNISQVLPSSKRLSDIRERLAARVVPSRPESSARSSSAGATRRRRRFWDESEDESSSSDDIQSITNESRIDTPVDDFMDHVPDVPSPVRLDTNEDDTERYHPPVAPSSPEKHGSLAVTIERVESTDTPVEPDLNAADRRFEQRLEEEFGHGPDPHEDLNSVTEIDVDLDHQVREECTPGPSTSAVTVVATPRAFSPRPPPRPQVKILIQEYVKPITYEVVALRKKQEEALNQLFLKNIARPVSPPKPKPPHVEWALQFLKTPLDKRIESLKQSIRSRYKLPPAHFSIKLFESIRPLNVHLNAMHRVHFYNLCERHVDFHRKGRRWLHDVFDPSRCASSIAKCCREAEDAVIAAKRQIKKYRARSLSPEVLRFGYTSVVSPDQVKTSRNRHVSAFHYFVDSEYVGQPCFATLDARRAWVLNCRQIRSFSCNDLSFSDFP